MVSTLESKTTRIPLLQTKLYFPETRRGVVSRPRLIERLNQGAGRKLTLISAPAGFGKTTLLAEWRLTSPVRDRHVGWVSLDQRDNDPVLFWSYVLLALKNVEPGLGERASTLLHAHDSQSIDSVLTALINDVSEIHADLTLVLDDFHVITSQSVSEGVAYLLEHMPPNFHLIIASRSDPPLPLARLRGRGESLELRVGELRFTVDEAAAFFGEAVEMRLSAGDVTALETRTEGWIAGLQLAALSMQGRADLPEFISAFAGDDRYIVDYLMEEVLQRQPEQLRSFLLETSILDRLNGSLCNAVTGRLDGKATLELLDRSNLFLVPLDDKRNWYRYHHLFGDVLRMRLLDEHPERVALLRQKAATWFEGNSMATEAIEQAGAANDAETLARLLVANFEELDRVGLYESIARWCSQLPDAMVRQRPRLALIYGMVAMRTESNLDPARKLFRWADDALTVLESRPASEPIEDHDGTVVGPEGLQTLRGELLALNLSISRDLSLEEMAQNARAALQLLPPSKHQMRAMLHQIAGGIATTLGHSELAIDHFGRGLDDATKTSNDSLVACFLTCHAEVHLSMGRLVEGRRQLEDALETGRRVTAGGELELCRACSLLAEVLLEQGELAKAAQHAVEAVKYAALGPLRSHILHGRTAAALVSLATGDAGSAYEHLHKAREFARGTRRFRYASHLAAAELRVFCGLGDLPSAEVVIRERGLHPSTAVTDENVEEMVAYARYLIANGGLIEADQVLSRSVDVSREVHRVRTEIQALALNAMVAELRSDRSRALDLLGMATKLGEDGHFVRTFNAEGPVLSGLLEYLANEVKKGQGPVESGSTGYLASLLGSSMVAAKSVSVTNGAEQLIEPLTEREIEILRLIVAGLRNQEIADQLFISLATVKRHIANAYGKLGVTHRGEAVARLGALSFN